MILDPKVQVPAGGAGLGTVDAQFSDYFPDFLNSSFKDGKWTFTMEYWEAWRVKPNQTHPTGSGFTGLLPAAVAAAYRKENGIEESAINDAFVTPVLPEILQGSGSIVGTVYYIDGLDELPPQFVDPDPNIPQVLGSPSGVLPVLSLSDPKNELINESRRRAMNDFLKNTAASRSEGQGHALYLTWDASKKGGMSSIDTRNSKVPTHK
jgi:hypothetical protein